MIYKKLDEVIECLIDYRGKTPKKSEKGIKMLSAKTVKMGYIDYDNAYCISQEEFNKFAVRGEVKKGDILVTTEAPLGCIAKLTRDDVGIAQRLLAIRCKKGVLDNDYLMYYLMSREGQHELLSRETGTTVTGIKQSEIRKIKVTLPELNVQKKTAMILSLIDSKIEENNKTNNNLYEIGESYYNYYFKQFEYTSELKESELGKIPIDYEIKTLSEVTKKNNHKVGNDTEFKVLSAVKTGNLQLSEEYFDKNVPSEKLNKYIVVNKDNYAYNPARINIGSIGRNEYDFKTCVSPVYVSFEVDLKYKYFFDFYFKDTKFKGEVLTRASGSVRQALKYDDFGLISIIYPSEKAINDFNFVYKEIDRNIKQKQKENQILEQLRDTLLPKLMNGEIDLENIEI